MKKLDKNIMLTAALLGAVTIGIGAFGAHGLRELVNEDALRSFETGVRYQMYHVLALLVVGSWASFGPSERGGINPIIRGTKKWVYRFFCLGILFFSGSLYFLALKDLLPFSVKFLGPVTPVGGLLFVIGWLRLAYGIIKFKSQYSN